MHVRRLKLISATALALEKRMSTSKCTYDFEEILFKPVTLRTSINSLDLSLHEGILPSKIQILHVTQTSFLGHLEHNPFYIDHCNLTHLSLDLNGSAIMPYFVNFSNVSGYTKLYLDSVIGRTCLIKSNGFIDKTKYANGHTIMTYMLEPWDHCNNGIRPMQRSGTLRLKIEYDTAVQRSATMIVMILLTFRRQLQITVKGQVSIE